MILILFFFLIQPTIQDVSMFFYIQFWDLLICFLVSSYLLQSLSVLLFWSLPNNNNNKTGKYFADHNFTVTGIVWASLQISYIFLKTWNPVNANKRSMHQCRHEHLTIDWQTCWSSSHFGSKLSDRLTAAFWSSASSVPSTFCLYLNKLVN